MERGIKFKREQVNRNIIILLYIIMVLIGGIIADYSLGFTILLAGAPAIFLWVFMTGIIHISL